MLPPWYPLPLRWGSARYFVSGISDLCGWNSDVNVKPCDIDREIVKINEDEVPIQNRQCTSECFVMAVLMTVNLMAVLMTAVADKQELVVT